LVSSRALRNRTAVAIPARLKATARLSWTMTRVAATAMGRMSNV